MIGSQLLKQTAALWKIMIGTKAKQQEKSNLQRSIEAELIRLESGGYPLLRVNRTSELFELQLLN